MDSLQQKLNLKSLIEEIKGCDWEVKSSEEIFTSHHGGDKRVNRSFKSNGDYPCVIRTDIFESQIYIDEHKTFVDLETVEKKTYIEKGDILVATDGYSPKKNKEGFCVYLNDNKPLAGSHMYVLKHNENEKYLVHAFSTDGVKKQLSALFTEGLSSIMRIFIRDIKKIKIPIPSLDLQEKIGNFLFSFTKYEKQLKKEMERRRKQFHFYREKIFGELIEKCELRNVN